MVAFQSPEDKFEFAEVIRNRLFDYNIQVKCAALLNPGNIYYVILVLISLVESGVTCS